MSYLSSKAILRNGTHPFIQLIFTEQLLYSGAVLHNGDSVKNSTFKIPALMVLML